MHLLGIPLIFYLIVYRVSVAGSSGKRAGAVLLQVEQGHAAEGLDLPERRARSARLAEQAHPHHAHERTAAASCNESRAAAVVQEPQAAVPECPGAWFARQRRFEAGRRAQGADRRVGWKCSVRVLCLPLLTLSRCATACPASATRRGRNPRDSNQQGKQWLPVCVVKTAPNSPSLLFVFCMQGRGEGGELGRSPI